MAVMISNRMTTELRLERLVAMLKQSNDLLCGMGQYVAEKDPNRKVLEEVIASNAVVIDQELDAMHSLDSKIITRV